MCEKTNLTEIKNYSFFLPASPSKITVEQLCINYSKVRGMDLPYCQLGYGTVLDFVKPIPDIVRLEWISSLNDFGLSSIEDSTGEEEENIKKKKKFNVSKSHIPRKRRTLLYSQNLIKFSGKNRFCKSKNFSALFKNQNNKPKRILQNKIYNMVHTKIRNDIQELLRYYENGLYLDDFPEAFRIYFKKNLSVSTLGFCSVKEYLMSIPDIVKLDYDLDEDNCIVLLNSKYFISNPDRKSLYRNSIFEFQSESSDDDGKTFKKKDIIYSATNKPSYINGSNTSDDEIPQEKPNFVNFDTSTNDYSLSNQQKSEMCDENKSVTKRSSFKQNLIIGNKYKSKLFPKIRQPKSTPIINQIKMWRDSKKEHANITDCNETKDMSLEIVQKSPKSLDEKPRLTNSKHNLETDLFMESNDIDNLFHYEFKNKKSNFISDDMKKEFRLILSFHDNGILASNFLHEYYRITKKHLVLSEYDFPDIIELVLSLPDVFRIHPSYSNSDYLLYDSEKFKPSIPSCKNADSVSRPPVINSLFDSSLRRNIISIMNNTEKVSLGDFMNIYKNKFGMELPWACLGYDSVESFIFDLCDVIPIKFSYGGSILFISLNLKEYQITEPINLTTDWNKILSDSVMPGEVYTPQPLPKKTPNYIPVYVSDIDNPDHFWIQLIGKRTSDALNCLMEKLQTVYKHEENNKYKMPEEFFKVGNLCAALWSDYWHRGIITEIVNRTSIEIFYVDYGTKSIVPKEFLRLLKKEFLFLPSQAIKSRLTNVRPINKTDWYEKTNERFLELCMDKPLAALITDIHFKDRISVCLCDSSNKEDRHINDILIKENLAEFYSDKLNSKENIKSNSYSNSYSCTTLSVINNEDSESNQKLHQCSSEIIVADFDCNITKIHLEENYEIHVIILNERFFVSSEDISSLLKLSDSLERTLLDKKILIPYIILRRPGNEELFLKLHQIKVKGIKEDSSYIIIYSIKDVIDILDCLEYNSENLKYAIKMETTLFSDSMSTKELNEAFQHNRKKKENIVRKMFYDGVCQTYLDELERIEKTINSLTLKLRHKK